MGTERHRAIIENPHRGGSHLALLLIIATYSDPGGEWVADQATLQRHACLSRRQIKRILDDLVATGDLAVASHQGRGRLSRYQLLRGSENLPPALPFAPSKAAAEVPFLAGKPDPSYSFFTGKAAPCVTFSGPLVPPFPRTPNPPLIPPKQQETCGLPPPAAPARQLGQATLLWSEEPVSPLPGKGGGSRERGGGEGLRPLSGPQSAVFRVNLLLEEAAVPLPSPAQIGLWCKTLGGVEPLLDLLRRLIQSGLATKRGPGAYIHRVVIEQAAHPEPKRPELQRFHTGRRAPNPLLMAGADDRRRELGRLIAAKRPV